MQPDRIRLVGREGPAGRPTLHLADVDAPHQGTAIDEAHRVRGITLLAQRLRLDRELVDAGREPDLVLGTVADEGDDHTTVPIFARREPGGHLVVGQDALDLREELQVDQRVQTPVVRHLRIRELELGVRGGLGASGGEEDGEKNGALHEQLLVNRVLSAECVSF